MMSKPLWNTSFQHLPFCRCSIGILQLWRPYDSHYFHIHRSMQRAPRAPCGGIIRYVFLSIRHLLAVNYIKAISVQHINEWSKDLRCSIFLYASQNINHVGDSPKQYINTVDLRLVVWSGCCKTTSNSLSDENVFLQGLVLFAWPLNKWLQGCFFLYLRPVNWSVRLSGSSKTPRAAFCSFDAEVVWKFAPLEQHLLHRNLVFQFSSDIFFLSFLFKLQTWRLILKVFYYRSTTNGPSWSQVVWWSCLDGNLEA